MLRFFDSLLGLLEIDEDGELVLQNARSERNGILSRHRAVRLHRKSQFIVVEDLAFACVLDFVGDLLDRAVEAVHWHQTDRRVLWTVAVGGNIPLAHVGNELHPDRCAFI